MDAIPARVTRIQYAERLKQARTANVNFLRVWGGGLKEKQAFYDLCDELGILVWQEFPFSGAFLDRFPTDPEFLKLVSDECSAIIRALRNHPSLVVWCGGNEFAPSMNRPIVELLQELVVRHDGTRPFKPASPYLDEAHNWQIWHRRANLRDYRKETSPFLSEFGLQSAPAVNSLRQFIPEEYQFPPGEMWVYHRAELDKLWRYATSILPNLPDRRAWTLEQFVEASQRAQAMGLQIAIEHMRRRKPQAAGVSFWQFNEPWGAISWSVVDYYGRPKRAYHVLKELYSPVLASFDYDLRARRPGEIVRGDVYLINDLTVPFEQAEVTALLDGREIFRRRVGVQPDSCARIGALEVRLGEGANLLRLLVNDDEGVLSDHSYDLNFFDVGEMNPLVAWLYPIYNWLMR